MVNAVYTALREVLVDGTATEIKKATSLEEITQLDAASLRKKTNVATSIAALLSRPDILALAAATLHPFLTTHRDAIAITAANLLPGIISGVMETSKTLASACNPNLDRKAIEEIITPIPVQILSYFDKSFYEQTLPVVLSLVNDTLADSNGLTKIMLAVQDIMNAPTGTQDKKVQNLIDVVFRFIDKNHDVKRVIEVDLPKILEKHSEALSGVIDSFLTRTEIGKALNIETKNCLV